jgi:SAM-dependent methyltransferase
MSDPLDYGADYAQKQIQRRESALRRLIKRFYIDHALQFVHGPTIDIGCGAGQLLERLPAGSIGVEENPILVDYLRSKGLKVIRREPDNDHPLLLPAEDGTAYRTVTLSHVLEHIPDAARHFRNLLDACLARGIDTVIVIVPGEKGFQSDQTHRTFICLDFIHKHNLLTYGGFTVKHASYFPGNLARLGNYFAYHELMLVYQRT